MNERNETNKKKISFNFLYFIIFFSLSSLLPLCGYIIHRKYVEVWGNDPNNIHCPLALSARTIADSFRWARIGRQQKRCKKETMNETQPKYDMNRFSTQNLRQFFRDCVLLWCVKRKSARSGGRVTAAAKVDAVQKIGLHFEFLIFQASLPLHRPSCTLHSIHSSSCNTPFR